ncbi:MAG TPA: fibronectin type III-like domain-contianing protein, partial [Chitinophagaceae bacterium]|nr:fibronectin type III-like domain-contianing protein [Chitinophagaceae bacterium]
YGLSYTKFEFSDLELSDLNPQQGEDIKITFTVTNMGDRAGDAVPQLYVHDEVSSVTTYVKKLRGFDRIYLNPGESKSVTFTITPKDLSIWDMNMDFTEEPGNYRVLIGHSSKNIVLKQEFEVH